MITSYERSKWSRFRRVSRTTSETTITIFISLSGSALVMLIDEAIMPTVSDLSPSQKIYNNKVVRALPCEDPTASDQIGSNRLQLRWIDSMFPHPPSPPPQKLREFQGLENMVWFLKISSHDIYATATGQLAWNEEFFLNIVWCAFFVPAEAVKNPASASLLPLIHRSCQSCP